MLKVRQVITSTDLRHYINLPYQLYSSFRNFVPPLKQDERRFHDEHYNFSLKGCEVVRYIALDEDKIVGRVMGIIPLEYNRLHQLQTARFFQLDCENDFQIFSILIQSIEKWAFSKGMKKLIGPFGFSDKDPQGLQIEGLENLPVIAAPYNPDYLPVLTEQYGFKKEIDCVSYKMIIPEIFPEYYIRIYRRLLQRTNFKLIEFKHRNELKPFIKPVFQLINLAYQKIYGFMPMHEPEMDYLASQYLPVLNPKYVKCITNTSGQLLAFVIAMPHMSEGLKKAKGNLFPFGFMHIINSMRRTRQLNLLLGAVHPDWQGLGLTTLLGVKLFESARDRFEFIDSHLILETNLRMRAEVERLGARVYKRFRIYQMNL